MTKKNYINTDGNGNIILQDISGENININDIEAIKKVFETAEPQYLKDLYQQIDTKYNDFIRLNETQIKIIISLIEGQSKNRNIKIKKGKNIIANSNISSGGNTIIGDTTIIHNYNTPNNKKEKSTRELIEEKTKSPYTIAGLLLIEIAIGLWGEFMPNEFQVKINELTNGHYTGAWILTGIIIIALFLYLKFYKENRNNKQQIDTQKNTLSDKLRKEFIEKLEKTYENRLKQKIDNRLEINLEYKNTIKGFEKQEITYFSKDMKNEKEVGNNLADIYQRNNTLVILGAPGSGKTSRLLDLAIELLQRAKKDNHVSIPVIINLAPWTPNNDFEEWIQNAIVNLYGYPKEKIKQAIENDEIVLFLDGFDEIGIKYTDKNEIRTDFINALTKFIKQTQKHKIVLCSRINEYENTQKYNWKFVFGENDAQILVKPISEKKIRETLKKAIKTGKQETIARELLEKFNINDKIKDIISTPFYFNAIQFIIAQNKIFNFPDNETEIQNYITKTYIDLKLNFQKEIPYTLEKSKKHLRWLAQWLKNKQNVTFELADFVPTNLKKPILFKILSGLVSGLVFGLVYGLVGGLVGEKQRGGGYQHKKN